MPAKLSHSGQAAVELPAADETHHPGPPKAALDAAGHQAVKQILQGQAPHVSAPDAAMNGLGYHRFYGSAFIKGKGDKHDVDPNDVKQGQLGDCWLLATLMSVARADPQAIHRIIKLRPDGKYVVTLHVGATWKRLALKFKTEGGAWTFDGGHPVEIVVDPIFAAEKVAGGYVSPFAQQGDETAKGDWELWPMLIERAVAIYLGTYDAMQTGAAKHGVPLFAQDGISIEVLRELPEDALLSMLAKGTKLRGIITAESRPSRSLTPDENKRAAEINLVLNHVYSVTGVDLHARTLNLQNPWGHAHQQNLSLKDFKQLFWNLVMGDLP